MDKWVWFDANGYWVTMGIGWIRDMGKRERVWVRGRVGDVNEREERQVENVGESWEDDIGVILG